MENLNHEMLFFDKISTQTDENPSTLALCNSVSLQLESTPIAAQAPPSSSIPGRQHVRNRMEIGTEEIREATPDPSYKPRTSLPRRVSIR